MRLAQRPPIPVVALGAGGSSLGVARSFGRLGIRVYAVSSAPRLAVYQSRYCYRGFLSPVSEFDSSSAEDLLEVAAAIGQKSILIPTDDVSAVFIEDHAKVLGKEFVFPTPRGGLARTLSNKKDMYFLARRCGVPTAKSVFPKCRREASEFAKNASYPLMLKRINMKGYPWNKVIVRTTHELLRQYDIMSDPHEQDLMIQEYVPWEDDTTWIFHGYFNHRSECLFGCTGRKLRQWPPYHGMTSIGITVRNEVLQNIAKRFLKRIGYRGIIDMDFREDSRNGQYKVLDVNPRIGGNFRLSVADGGMDVARALYLDMTGEEVIVGRIPEGRKWLVEDLDVRASIRYHADATLPLWRWASSYRGIRELAIFAFDDPFPMMHAAVHKIARLADLVQ